MSDPVSHEAGTGHEVFPGILFSAVLFDMDGTLIDSTVAVERSWAIWAEEEGLDLETVFHSAHGRPAAQLVASAVPPERAAQSLRRLTDLEEGDVDGITMLPGIHVLLADLPTDRWAIVTSSTRDLAHLRLAAGGVDAPRTVITFDDVVQGKPSPEPFLKGAKALAVEPESCLVVEDSITGLIAGRRAGCTTLAIAGTHPSADLAEHADAVIESFGDVAFELHDGGLRLVMRKARI